MKRRIRAFARRAARSLRLPPAGHVLVTGAPRSGTSALIQWFGQQPGVANFFEPRILISAAAAVSEVRRFRSLMDRRDECLKEIRRATLSLYAERQRIAGRVVIDKEPLEPVALPSGDYRGFIDAYFDLFPDGRLIWMSRDPESVVWSMRSRTWGASLATPEERVLSLDECIDVWSENTRLAVELKGDPRVHVCSFERLVDSPKSESARLCAHARVTMRTPFSPRPVANPGFSQDELQRIRSRTSDLFQAV